MQIAVTGEGHTDYGQRDYYTNQWLDGPIQGYMKKIADRVSQEPLEFHVLEKEDVRRVKVQQRNLKGLKGMGIPAKKFSILMKEKGLRKGVFYSDTDKESRTKNTEHTARKQFEERYQEIAEGLEGTDAIPMVPLRMIESWILADENALGKVLDKELDYRLMPKSPELLWGAKANKGSDYPKHYLHRLTGREAHREFFAEIAEQSSVEKMLEKCPISYGQFYSDFTALLQNSFAS